MSKSRKIRYRSKMHKKIPGVAICHPRYKSRKTNRCLSQDQIKKIASSVNTSIGRNDLAKHLGCSADDEICLLRKSGLSGGEKKEIEDSAFRPKMPGEWKENIRTWLSDYDIQQVMKQYEEAYPEFTFLEVAPIDFSAQDPNIKDHQKCIVDTFCKINLKESKAKGKTKIGAIFNLDPSYKGGSHWVGLFIDINKNEVNYFDSYGFHPPDEIKRLMKSLTLQNKNILLQYNQKKFQYKNSECGMFSMIFIISMLNGEDFKHFCKNPITDDEANSFRQFLYRGIS